MKTSKTLALALCAASALALAAAQPASATDLHFAPYAKGGNHGGGGPKPPPPPPPQIDYDFGSSRALNFRPWMHTEMQNVFGTSYLGQGVAVTFVDDFNSGSTLSGNLTGTSDTLTHGYWTSTEGGMIAPSAHLYGKDFSSGSTPVTIRSNMLNVFNASYGWIEYDYAWTGTLDAQEQSLVDAAQSGAAVVVKSAGNDYGAAVGDGTAYLLVGRGKPKSGYSYDYFALGMIDAASAPNFSGIFVGALSANSTEVWNGTPYTGTQVGMASYSTIAGSNTDVQNHFLVVGVDSGQMGNLAGTSFAAPIVTGYAAILGSKFYGTTTTDGTGTVGATEIANRLLDTARTDTLINYTPQVYGRGEASIWRALAPDSIN